MASQRVFKIFFTQGSPKGAFGAPQDLYTFVLHSSGAENLKNLERTQGKDLGGSIVIVANNTYLESPQKLFPQPLHSLPEVTLESRHLAGDRAHWPEGPEARHTIPIIRQDS